MARAVAALVVAGAPIAGTWLSAPSPSRWVPQRPLRTSVSAQSTGAHATGRAPGAETSRRKAAGVLGREITMRSARPVASPAHPRARNRGCYNSVAVYPVPSQRRGPAMARLATRLVEDRVKKSPSNVHQRAKRSSPSSSGGMSSRRPRNARIASSLSATTCPAFAAGTPPARCLRYARWGIPLRARP